VSIETATRAQAVALLRDAELDVYADELEGGFADARAIRAERERILGLIEEKVGELWRTGRFLWAMELQAEMQRIREGADPMPLSEFAKLLEKPE
jgi:hypothetical protein